MTDEHRTDALSDGVAERVLLATDGGDAGEAAVRWLVDRSAAHRLAVEVLMVVEFDPLNGQYYGDDLTADAERVVRRVESELLTAAPGARVRTAVRTGDPRDVFESASGDVDLLVVGSNHDSPWRGLFGASFSVKMAEGARCPVVVVPRSWQPVAGPVVVGIRGDESDRMPLRFAIREARLRSLPLRVVHVSMAPRVIGVRLDAAKARERGESVLTDTVARVRREDPGLAVTGSLVAGDPAESLLLQSADAALLVVGSHTRTGLERFFLGSVSRDVLLQPPCAVAVVRPGWAGHGADAPAPEPGR